MRQIGELMDDHVRMHGIDRKLQPVGIVDIDQSRHRAERLKGRGLGLRARGADHVMPGAAQQDHEPASDRAGGAGKKHFHIRSFVSRGIGARPDRHFRSNSSPAGKVATKGAVGIPAADSIRATQ